MEAAAQAVDVPARVVHIIEAGVDVVNPSEDDLEPGIQRVLFAKRARNVSNLHGATEIGVFPVELCPDPLVQIPVKAGGRLEGFGAGSIGGARGTGGKSRGESLLADFKLVDPEDQFPSSRRSDRQAGSNGWSGCDLLRCSRSVAPRSGNTLPIT